MNHPPREKTRLFRWIVLAAALLLVACAGKEPRPMPPLSPAQRRLSARGGR